MPQYDIDFEILYTIKEGNHTFSHIWQKVKGIGSKQSHDRHHIHTRPCPLSMAQ